jgi:hypothetical protein
MARISAPVEQQGVCVVFPEACTEIYQKDPGLVRGLPEYMTLELDNSSIKWRPHFHAIYHIHTAIGSSRNEYF